MYDYLIAGAGFTGAVLTERLASVSRMKILITDRRTQTGGNAYDYHDSNGVRVHSENTAPILFAQILTASGIT